MKVLIIQPANNYLKYCLFVENRGLIIKNKIKTYRDNFYGYEESLNEIKKYLSEREILLNTDLTPDCVVLHSLYGGQNFKGITNLNKMVIEELKKLVPESPFYIPGVVRLGEDILEIFKDVSVKAIVFESAFFVSLPDREKNYAIDVNVAERFNAVRTGFKGLYHEESARFGLNSVKKNKKESVKILSICLDPKPEAAAILNLKPVMVTSGVTLLEGIIGDTCSGDIDTGILITLAEKTKWGYEMLNRLLTEESGFKALAGKIITLFDIFEKEDKYEFLKEVFLYKLLQITGYSIAALEGLDVIIFSGKYRKLGEKIGPFLLEKINNLNHIDKKLSVKWQILDKDVEEIIAEQALLIAKEKQYLIA